MFLNPLKDGETKTSRIVYGEKVLPALLQKLVGDL